MDRRRLDDAELLALIVDRDGDALRVLHLRHLVLDRDRVVTAANPGDCGRVIRIHSAPRQDTRW